MLRKLLNIGGDKVIWVVCVLLSAISLIWVYSSIGYAAITDMNTSPTMAFIRHTLFVVAAYVVAVIASNLNYQLYSRIAPLLYAISVGLVLLTLLTGSRWIHVPLIGRFQPSEVAKIFTVLLTARTLAVYPDKLSPKWLFWFAMLPVALLSGIILPLNLSTTLLVFVCGLVMMFIGGVKKSYIIKTVLLILVAGVVGLWISYKVFHSSMAEMARHTPLARAETWSNRVDHWLNPDIDETSQENMASMAVADGGLVRMNIGGTVHARLMTQANNDFIYAIIVEEAGSLVGIIIFLLYTVFYYRCVMLAYWSGRRFGGLLIFGLGTSIYTQALAHMLVCVGVIPVTGQTLPLISTGGTAYVITGFSIGMIQSVAKSSARQKKKSNQAADNRETTSTLTTETIETNSQPPTSSQ